MNRAEARDVNTVLVWAMERAVRPVSPRPVVSDVAATAAARRLAGRARRRLPGGLLPDEVTLAAPGPEVPSCWP